MLNKHSEIEVKLDASGISEFYFLSWVFSKEGCTRYLQVSGPDFFYRNGEHVVRIRVPPDGPVQVTVKKRKSQQSIRDRVEIEYEVEGAEAFENLDAHYRAIGFEKDLFLEKKAHIFWFKKGKQEVIVSYYLATCNGETKPFLEIEVSKDSEVALDTAKGYLKKWVDEVNNQFKTDLQPLNKSLYEYFKDRSLKNE